jgi:alginate O-acetyltransferase complex protein AlgJ
LADKDPRSRRLGEWLIVLLFIAGIANPLALASWNAVRDASPSPAALLRTIEEDAPGHRWRRNLIRDLQLGAFRSSPNPSAVVGAGGWLFLLGPGRVSHFPLEYFRRTRPFSARELERWRAFIELRRRWFEKRGITYLLVIAPNKSTIYPDRVPTRITQLDRPSRLDQLMRHLPERERRFVLDLRTALRARDEHGALYDPGDTHWNDAGAHLAYQALMDRLAELHPGPWSPVVPAQLTDETVAYGDLASFLENPKRYYLPTTRSALNEVFWRDRAQPLGAEALSVLAPGPDWPSWAEPFVAERPGTELPTAVVFRDSFFDGLAPFVAEHFSRLVCVYQPNFRVWDHLSMQIDTRLIDRERPDIVIEQIAERYLIRAAPDPQLAAAPSAPRR